MVQSTFRVSLKVFRAFQYYVVSAAGLVDAEHNKWSDLWLIRIIRQDELSVRRIARVSINTTQTIWTKYFERTMYINAELNKPEPVFP